MPTPSAAMTPVHHPVAEAFERKADDFAALAEAADTFEDVVRYRDLERSYRLRAEQERLREISYLYRSAGNDNARTAA